MDIFLICSLCVCACVIMKLVEKDNKEMKTLIALALVIVIFSQVIESLTDGAKALKSMLDEIAMPEEYVEIMLKALGVSLVSKLASECCKDCGENAVSAQVELACRISLLAISLPLYKTALSIVIGLIDS